MKRKRRGEPKHRTLNIECAERVIDTPSRHLIVGAKVAKETMISTNAVRLVFITVAVAMLLAQNVSAAETNATQTLIAGETAFAFDLYGQLKTRDGNLFFSPYSISTCLGMTYVGARGDTARQMARVLHFNAAPLELPTPMGALENQLNEVRQKKGIELNTANGLWAQAGHPFLPAYLQICQQQFGARINQVDFRTGAEAARKEINDWVASQTKDKITDLLQSGVINNSTRLVLVNAIYFKGRWTFPFNKSQTANAPFMITPSQKVQAPLMHQKAMFRHAETDDFQLLELPYADGGAPAGSQNDGQLSMVVLLPKETDGLKKLERSLNEPALNQWLAQAHSQEVNVFLPKFKMTVEFSLADTLAKMGMSKPFSAQADFSGMDGNRDLFISAVVHKAFVDVNEEGTEAAAATGVTVRASAVMRTTGFRADHPFIFLIRDTRSGSILFLGRVSDPTK